jgi:hypothetical protein
MQPSVAQLYPGPPPATILTSGHGLTPDTREAGHIGDNRLLCGDVIVMALQITFIFLFIICDFHLFGSLGWNSGQVERT